MLNLNSKIEELGKIGSAYQKKLKKIGIETIRDFLYYLPSRYDDFSNILSINKIKGGERICVQGRIVEIGTTKTFRKWIDVTEAIIEDETGAIKAIWFNQPYIEKSLKEEDVVCLAGKVSIGKGGLYFNNPAYEKIYTNNDDSLIDLTHTGRIVPVYQETKGLTSKWLRYIIKPLLIHFHDKISEILPEEILKKHKFLTVKQALWQVHFPDSFESADAAKARFSFENLFLLQISILKEKIKIAKKTALACPMNVGIMKKFADSLPFQLTDSQKQCAYQILKDMEKPFPMSRLLEGDVGSGKTVVATMAALNSVKNSGQVAFMAPTEILAKQHFKTASDLLEKFKIKIGLMTGRENRFCFKNKMLEIGKKDMLEKLKNGEIEVVIGTHSLIQKNVEFKNLALLVIDEQHRFGVNQRARLTKNDKIVPHLLSMTATPIPRTLALTVYGDLDLSLIKEMPKNRKKVKTIIVDQQNRKSAYEFIREEIKKEHGVFVICPKIEPKNNKQGIGNSGQKEKQIPSIAEGFFEVKNYFFNPEITEIKAVKEEYEKLSKEIFPDLRIAMLYGKMKPKEKEKIMLDFKNNKLDILISTSVVEVGVDVPRATIMMIEGAERFGLAQLHQFRGRVGRSEAQSYCFLFTTEPNQLNRKRLKALVECNNGFELAQKDMEIRGPGQLYGSQQWGIPDTAMEGISNVFLVEKTRAAAKEILEKDSELANYPALQEQLLNFKQKIHFE